MFFDNLKYPEVESLSYRPFGGAKAMDTGGGGTVGSQFDDAGRITVSNPGAEHEETFTYDNNGNLTSINSLSLPYHNRVYGYDALDRLEHAEGPWGIIDYTYDNMGNRQTKIVDSVTDTYAYVTGTNIIDSITNGTIITYTHDTNGNTTGINNKILTYNQNNRLIRVEEDSVTLGEYTYNGLGQRIIKEADGVTTVFHYDFDGNIIGESDAAGSFSKEYLYRGSSRLALVDVSSEEIYYYGNDHLGTPIILTDSTNTVVWEAMYKPFGEAEVNPNSEVVNNFRFAGQYFDQETGLHYNYLRYYESQIGKFLTPDPIGQEGSINLYSYVENNPINSIDSLGLRPVISDDISNRHLKDAFGPNYRKIIERYRQIQILMAAAAIFAPPVPGFCNVATRSTPRSFRHYGYASDAAKFKGGLNKGAYATRSLGRPMHGKTAQQKLSLPHEKPPDAYYKVKVGSDIPVEGPTPVENTLVPLRSGGGFEFKFPEGTPPGSVTGPFPIPE